MQYAQKSQADTEYRKEKGPVSLYIATNNRNGWSTVASLFRRDGFEVKIASNAEELRQNFQENQKPQLLVIDIQKRRAKDQGPNGFQVATLLKESRKCEDVPILLIDDSNEDSMTQQCFTQPEVTFRRYGEPRIHRHVIKKLLQAKTEDDSQTPAS